MCFNIEFQSSHLACRTYPRHVVNSQLFVVCPKRIEARKQARVAAKAALRDAIWVNPRANNNPSLPHSDVTNWHFVLSDEDGSDYEGVTDSSVDHVEELGGTASLAAGSEILAQSQSPNSAFLNDDWDYVNNCPAATCDEEICEYIGSARSWLAGGLCAYCNGWKKWETITHVVTAPNGMLDPLMNALMALRWPGDPGFGVPEREEFEDQQSETELSEDEQSTDEQSAGEDSDEPFWDFDNSYDFGWVF